MARLLSRLRMARATVQQHVAKAETALAKRRERLAAIEAAISRLTPELPLDAIPRQPNPIFSPQRATRLTLDILREAPEPVPVIVITMRALASKGFVLAARSSDGPPAGRSLRV